MKKTTSKHLRIHYLVFTFLIFLLAFSSCRKEELPAPSDFTKEKREKLGDMMKIAITADAANFPVLSYNNASYDSTYWYIQKLYNQAINVVKNDGQSPTDDRWDSNREWKVTILDIDDEKTAFITPGGNLFLSTGLLKSLEAEYELYYILTFEATLMHERYVLNRLINEFNATTLNNFVTGVPAPPGSPDLEEAAKMLADLEFEKEMTMEVDEKAVSLICKSSIFDRTGIISIMDHLEVDETKWMQTRKSYDYRDQLDFILNLPVETGDDCGSFQSNGGYQEYVLGRL